MEIRLHVEGHVDDLYALHLLFPEGGFEGLHVVTALKGKKDGPLDRVTDASDRRTYVTGDGCAPLLEANNYGAGGWVAREILAPLNGYACWLTATIGRSGLFRQIAGVGMLRAT